MNARPQVLDNGVLFGIQIVASLSFVLSTYFENPVYFCVILASTMLLSLYSALFESSVPQVIWGKQAWRGDVTPQKTKTINPREAIAERAANELMEKIENLQYQPFERQTYRRQLKALISDEYCPDVIRRRVLKRHKYLRS
ncbi:MAG: hypothetical protein ACPGN3_06780 [Opitutales bacterium]